MCISCRSRRASIWEVCYLFSVGFRYVIISSIKLIAKNNAFVWFNFLRGILSWVIVLQVIWNTHIW